MTGFSQFFQREIAGRDQPHINPKRMARADWPDITLREAFQQAGLHCQRQTVDLVKRQSAAVGMLQGTDMAVKRAWKGAFFVAEQRRFNRISRDRADVEEPERGLGTRAGGLDGADQRFLTSAAFAFDQHRAVIACGLCRHGQRGAERRRSADHGFEIGRAGHFLGQRLQLVARGFAGGSHPQGLHQPIRRDRFDHIIGCTGAHRLNCE